MINCLSKTIFVWAKSAAIFMAALLVATAGCSVKTTGTKRQTASAASSKTSGQLESQTKSAAGRREKWVIYEQKTELIGTVRKREAYGPPNYGETPGTDEKDTFYVLILDSPINVRPGPNDEFNSAVRGIMELQLTLPSNGMPLADVLGKKVAAEGSLFQAHTGHHYTEVVMDVEGIRRR